MTEKPWSAPLGEKISVIRNTAFSRNYSEDVDPLAYEQYVLSYGRGHLAQRIAGVFEHYLPSTNPHEENPKVLDIASGTGLIAEALMDQGYIVTAMDINPRGLELLHTRRTEIHTKVADMNDNLPFDNNSFDGITSVWANRFITNTDVFISEVHRVLRPDGVFVWPLFPMEGIIWKINAGIRQHVTQNSLSNDLRRIGFSEVQKLAPDYISEVKKRELPIRTIPGFLIARK